LYNFLRRKGASFSIRHRPLPGQDIARRGHRLRPDRGSLHQGHGKAAGGNVAEAIFRAARTNLISQHPETMPFTILGTIPSAIDACLVDPDIIEQMRVLAP
jgi:hypothetical protein